MPYLAKMAGINAQMVWKGVKLLKSVLEKDEPDVTEP